MKCTWPYFLPFFIQTDILILFKLTGLHQNLILWTTILIIHLMTYFVFLICWKSQSSLFQLFDWYPTTLILQTEFGKVISKINGFEKSDDFGLKCYFKLHPIKLLIFAFIVNLAIFAFGIRICEYDMNGLNKKKIGMHQLHYIYKWFLVCKCYHGNYRIWRLFSLYLSW